MAAKEQAKIEIERLVQRFEDHKLDYKQSAYNETQTRRDFIDPFFKALGWDIDNEASTSEAYRDVIHEDKVRVENKLKSPDYSFRYNGKRCFFVEAKKPSINVKDDADPAYQVKRYAWSAKLKLSIVTDFEEFAIYDCSSKPKPTDKASVARIDYIKHTEYINKFDFIWDTFSKEAVQTGGYDKFVNRDKKKGTTSVDDDFLKSLDSWRTTLAKDIFKNNSKLSEDHLNHVVQHTIDRIIFLRIAEDRNIEVYGSIQNCLKEKDSAYKSLYELFLKAHDKYNSGLFNFEKDSISKNIIVSDKCLSEIIDNLYFPSSPYEFSVIPVEILGSAYEQFLGKTIQIKKGKINIDEKPEVRRAGGVYYTPQYIVDYIVQNTVGKLIENKTPKEIEKIKILDPASGSGSFLLGAYDYLLKHHHNWYSKNLSKSKGKKSDPLNPDGSLTTDVKKRILINNIYGVDIDANAVEVTKLSLLLKCLEGETQASIQSQMTLFNERILPTLDQNIKCGNSLVSTDFFEIETDSEVWKKAKPFNWQIEFKDVFRQGGFDAVIGNPPYGATLTNNIKDYLISKYKEGNKFIDTYCIFMLSSKQIVKDRVGLISMIVPNTFCDNENCVDFRRWLLEKVDLNLIWKTGFAFEDAIVDTLVFLFVNNIPAKMLNVNIDGKYFDLDKSIFFNDELLRINFRMNENNNSLSAKIGHNSVALGSICNVKAGVKLYEKGKGLPPQTEYIVSKKIYNTKGKKPKGWQVLRRGKDIQKYSVNKISEYVNYGQWLAAPRNRALFIGTKILMRRTDDKLLSTIDNTDSICVNSCHVIKFKEKHKNMSYPYLLGLLNSKLMQYIFEVQNPQMVGKVFSEIKVVYVTRLPIKISDQKVCAEKIIKFVNHLLELNKSGEPDQKQLQHYENQIDKLVYELYGLTKDEIKIIEETTNGNN